mgnify:CR=1 FL=1
MSALNLVISAKFWSESSQSFVQRTNTIMVNVYKLASKEIDPAAFWVASNRVADGGDHWLDSESGLPLAIVRTVDQSVMRLVARGTIPPRAYHEYDELYLEKYCLPSFEQSVSAFYIDELPIGRSRFEAWEQGWANNVLQWPSEDTCPADMAYGVALSYAVHVGARLPTEAEFQRAAQGTKDIPDLAHYEHDDYLRERMKERHRARRRKAIDSSNSFGLRFMDVGTWTSTPASEYLDMATHMSEEELEKLREKFCDHLFRRSFRYVFLAAPERTIGVRFALSPKVFEANRE